ncbi:MAG: helix-hairpin-helix domain-containing protein [Candidatus Ozemobacteraceae bacterium]
MTHREKGIFVFLGSLLLLGMAILSWKVFSRHAENKKIDVTIAAIAAMASRPPLIQGLPIMISSGSAAFVVSANTGQAEDFDRIPGIGKTLAERIVEFRLTRGTFHSFSELLEVKGMTSKKLETFLPFLSLATESLPPVPVEIKRVNLNLATKEDLDTLPGIGPTLAEAILRARQVKGGFRSIDDLLETPGLGEATFRKFADRVEVR